jgi:hypothetical protein
MKSKRTIEIVVSPIGDISIDAIGFKSADCEQATRFLEQALGATKERIKKPEYFRQRENRQQQRLGS